MEGSTYLQGIDCPIHKWKFVTGSAIVLKVAKLPCMPVHLTLHPLLEDSEIDSWQLYMNSAPRILICRTDAIGDNVLSLPVADDLKTAIPGCRITWISKPAVSPLIRLDRNVDEILEWDGNVDPEPLFPRIFRRFDAVVVIHPKPKKWLSLMPLLLRARIPIRVGTGRRWWGFLLYTQCMWDTRHHNGMHECARARSHGRVLLKAFGADVTVCDRAPRTGLVVSEAELLRARDWLAWQGLERPVILHVGSNGSAAGWPIESMAHLADQLADSRTPVVISTGFNRPDLEQRMRSLCSRVHVYTPGAPCLEELAALLKNAGCVVACSTGPLHLAAALGVPTVGLYPSVNDCLPAQWGPLGDRAINLVAPTPSGGQYRRRHLMDPAHMTALEVDTVLQSVKRQISPG